MHGYLIVHVFIMWNHETQTMLVENMLERWWEFAISVIFYKH
jgi:hypothetical protein